MKGILNPALIIVLVIITILLALWLIILPPSRGKVTPFLDAAGKVMPSSIAEKVFVDVNGSRQGMIIRGEDKTKPVILFLSGGPGIPEYLLSYEYPTDLEKNFVVCYWSYRGNGLSFNSKEKEEDMTISQYMADSITVTEYLRKRFSKEKIILLAHSFGTEIGIQVASEHPELYSCYIAMSQVVDQSRSEKIAFDYMKAEYEKAGNTKMVKKFDAYNIDNPEDLNSYMHSLLRDNAMHGLGVGTTRTMKNVITDIFFPSLRMKDFTMAERINIWRGKAFSAKCEVVGACFSYNLAEKVPSLDIPIYFLCGKYDYTCVQSLQKEYYEKIKAPTKGFFLFENSAHSPLFEEREKAVEIIKKVTNEK